MGLRVSKKVDISSTPKKTAPTDNAAVENNGEAGKIEKIPDTPEKPLNGEVIVTTIETTESKPENNTTENNTENNTEGQTQVEVS